MKVFNMFAMISVAQGIRMDGRKTKKTKGWLKTAGYVGAAVGAVGAAAAIPGNRNNTSLAVTPGLLQYPPRAITAVYPNEMDVFDPSVIDEQDQTMAPMDHGNTRIKRANIGENDDEDFAEYSSGLDGSCKYVKCPQSGHPICCTHASVTCTKGNLNTNVPENSLEMDLVVDKKYTFQHKLKVKCKHSPDFVTLNCNKDGVFKLMKEDQNTCEEKLTFCEKKDTYGDSIRIYTTTQEDAHKKCQKERQGDAHALKIESKNKYLIRFACFDADFVKEKLGTKETSSSCTTPQEYYVKRHQP